MSPPCTASPALTPSFSRSTWFSPAARASATLRSSTVLVGAVVPAAAFWLHARTTTFATCTAAS
eukprot:6838355-Pyramimonas_sp.AAC.1